MQSDSIDQLAAALSAAQAEMPNASLSKVNPHFRSKYADLAAIREATLPSLTKHGLSIFQSTRLLVDHMILATKLAHSSGQWVGSEYPIPMSDKPQVMGSALTYARRYSWAALCGVASEEDDDANAAQEGAKGNGTAKRTMKEISANKQRREAECSEIQRHLQSIASIEDLEEYKETKLTPAFMESLGNAQWAIEQWCGEREEELKATAPEGTPQTRAEFIQGCHDKIASATDATALLTWWNGDKAARTRFSLSKDESAELRERVMERRDKIVTAVFEPT